MNTPSEKQPPRLAAEVVKQNRKNESDNRQRDRMAAIGQSRPPLTVDDVAEILSYVPSRPPYPEWIAIIAAVGDVLSENDAVAVLSTWSPEETQGEYARKIRTRCQRVGIGTLINRAKANGFDAKAFTRRRVDRSAIARHRPAGTNAIAPTARATSVVAKAEPLPPLPMTTAAVWREGIEHLQSHPEIVTQVDAWRGWPAGTAQALVEDGLLSSPVTYGTKRGLAFPVQAPERCELGFVQTRQIGFHIRHKPQPGHRAAWSYHPNDKRDGHSTPGLPFVIGAAYASCAHTAISTEGPWDAITLAAAAGWLANDPAWPEGIVLFGTRGAGGWRALWLHWRPFLPRGVAFVLFPDADEAGAQWTSPGGFRDTLAAAGHPVRVVRSQTDGAKDLNDLHRLAPLTVEQIVSWLGKEVGK
jgi:hypothetical protein